MAALMSSSWNTVLTRLFAHPADESVDSLMPKVLRELAQTYGLDGVVWVGTEGPPDPLGVYAGGSTWRLSEKPTGSLGLGQACVALSQLPEWLAEWLISPALAQLNTGDLLIPIFTVESNAEDGEEIPPAVPLVLQLRRSPHPAATAADTLPLLSEAIAPIPSPTDWSETELSDLIGFSQGVGLSYQFVIQQGQLMRIRRQSALMGRIAHLLNSSLDADVLLQQMLAEVGQGYGCDRCLLLDLRSKPAVTLTAQWDEAEDTPSVPDWSALSSRFWPTLVEQFLQDGVSYLALSSSANEGEEAADLCSVLKAEGVLLVPVFAKTEFFGLLALVSQTERPPYYLEELQTLYQIADHVAIALNELLSAHTARPSQVERWGDRAYAAYGWSDPLTRLPNRDALEHELMRLSHVTLWPVQPDFSLLLLDIDYFKLINDTYGNRAGDEVLQELAQRLQHQLRQGTLMYRYDGEEFLIILSDTILNHAADVAERLRATVQQEPMKTSAGVVEVTVSFGVAQRDRTRDADASSVVQRAEQAVLEAKRQGRNRIKVL